MKPAIVFVLIVTEYLTVLNPPGNDMMMQRIQCVNSGLSEHELKLAGFA